MAVAALRAVERNTPPSGVTIEYDTKGTAYFYMIVEDGENIGIFASSYQPEKQNDDWSAAQTRSASWHWSDDGVMVAIEEPNHRLIGTVILAWRVYGAYEPVPLAIHEFMARSGEEWDRGRLFFGGWVDDDRARIILFGRTGNSPGPHGFAQYGIYSGSRCAFFRSVGFSRSR